jgi:uncharacterized protein YihD (DUF1040 family)
MPTTYAVLPEAETIANRCYPMFKDWPDLPKIKFLMKIADKSDTAGQISKATGKWKYLTQYDYVMELWDGFWTTATDFQKEAVVYHELYHIKFKEDDETAEITWGLKKHDLEEFADVVKKYGAWNDTLKEFKMLLNLDRGGVAMPVEKIADLMEEKTDGVN